MLLGIVTFIWNDFAWILLPLVTVVLLIVSTCFLDRYDLFGYHDKLRLVVRMILLININYIYICYILQRRSIDKLFKPKKQLNIKSVVQGMMNDKI